MWGLRRPAATGIPGLGVLLPVGLAFHLVLHGVPPERDVRVVLTPLREALPAQDGGRAVRP
jgi:hypothetical protein